MKRGWLTNNLLVVFRFGCSLSLSLFLHTRIFGIYKRQRFLHFILDFALSLCIILGGAILRYRSNGLNWHEVVHWADWYEARIPDHGLLLLLVSSCWRKALSLTDNSSFNKMSRFYFRLHLRRCSFLLFGHHLLALFGFIDGVGRIAHLQLLFRKSTSCLEGINPSAKGRIGALLGDDTDGDTGAKRQ